MYPNELVNKLSELYGDNLVSVTLYGSAVDSDFEKGHSDHNIIMIVKDLAPAELAKSAKLVTKWVREGNSLPLFFTTETIKSSTDVFPIEFFDIKERHKVLFGSDTFEHMLIDGKNLRLQCEHELRSKLLTLHSTFSVIANEPKKVLKLILESSSSFFAIFRGVLRIAGVSPSSSKKVMLEQITKLTGVDTGIFLELVDVREKNNVWRKNEALEKFEQYLTSIEAVVKYTDSI